MSIWLYYTVASQLAAWQLVVWFGIPWWLFGSYHYLFYCYMGKFVGLIYSFNVSLAPGLMERRWWLITSTSRLTILCWWLYFFLIYISILLTYLYIKSCTIIRLYFLASWSTTMSNIWTIIRRQDHPDLGETVCSDNYKRRFYNAVVLCGWRL